MLTGRRTGWIVALAMTGVVAGLAVSMATTSPTVARFGRFPASVTAPFPGLRTPFPGAFRSAAVGTVKSVSGTQFAMTSRTGQTVTVDEQASTAYRNRTGAAASASAITAGTRVIVFGSTSGSTIKATQIVILPAGISRFSSLFG